MPENVKKGDRGDSVRLLQQTLVSRGYSVAIDGEFGPQTQRAVKAFQSQNLDPHGQPLKVDGKVGPLTWWSLTHPKPYIEAYSAVDYCVMPPVEAGGSHLGRSALAIALEELKAGAGEVGGDNRGPWVRKYLAPAGLDEGNSWCASFVSWCFLRACGGDKQRMPFVYSPGARDLLRQCDKLGLAHAPGQGYLPEPGDLVVWWRVSLAGWQGHVGLVHQLRDGMLYTLEGNRSPRVQGFSYVFSRMDKLLGFAHVADRP